MYTGMLLTRQWPRVRLRRYCCAKTFTCDRTPWCGCDCFGACIQASRVCPYTLCHDIQFRLHARELSMHSLTRTLMRFVMISGTHFDQRSTMSVNFSYLSVNKVTVYCCSHTAVFEPSTLYPPPVRRCSGPGILSLSPADVFFFLTSRPPLLT
jgi:hypothetical protein